MFMLEDLEAIGIATMKSKVLVNCLVKLGWADLGSGSQASGGAMAYALRQK